MDFELGHIISIAILDLIGIFVNSWFLYTVKTRSSQLNAIDILQACKTGLGLLSLIVCVWMEFVTCTSKLCMGAKAIADDLFYFSTSLTFLAIAHVRYKACKCRGQASNILTHWYVVKTLLICFVPVGIFAVANLSLVIDDKRRSLENNETTNLRDDDIQLLFGNSKTVYEICHLLVFTFIPIFFSAMLYYKICTIVTQTVRTVESAITKRKQDPSKLITLPIMILMSTMLLLWGIYSTVLIISLYVRLNGMFFVYWKLVILIVQPLGEGLLYKSGRKSSISRATTLSQARSSRQIYPISSPVLSGSSIADSCVGALQLSTLIEECEMQTKSLNEKTIEMEGQNTKKNFKARKQSNTPPRASFVIQNAATIGLEYQDNMNSTDLHKLRNTSEVKPKNEVLNLGKDALNRNKTRRLSNCSRLTSSADNDADHIIHDTYNSKGKQEKINSASSSENESPSRKRWKKLYTKSKSVRSSQDIKTKISPFDLKKGSPKTSEKKLPLLIDKDNLNESDQKLKSVQRVTTTYPDQEQFSFKRSLKQKLSGKFNIKSSKQRSISCISDKKTTQNCKVSGEKNSVSFISSIKLDSPSTSFGNQHSPKAISYDSKIYLSYGKKSRGKNTKVRYWQGHRDVDPHCKERSDVVKWLNNKSTTREECIAKLMEMKEYL